MSVKEARIVMERTGGEDFNTRFLGSSMNNPN